MKFKQAVMSLLYIKMKYVSCAPTGAGKTNIALLCICHELKKHISLIDNTYYGVDDKK